MFTVPRTHGQRLDSRQITSCTARLVLVSGGRVAWEPRPPYRIAFDRRGGDDFCDLWLVDEDGASNFTNLTNQHASLPGFHAGGPAWDPAGRYIVFTAQRSDQAPLNELSTPGSGLWMDLYLYHLDDGAVTLLYTAPTPGDATAPGILHPHFDATGARLCFARKIGGATGSTPSGVWDVVVANVVDGATPGLADVQAYQWGAAGGAIAQSAFHETHGFTPDGQGILYSANPLNTHNQLNMDVFVGALGRPPNGTTRTRLTLSSGLVGEHPEWDEHAHYSPDGRSILWGPSSEYGTSPLKGDYYLMDSDGGNKRRLTYFNVAGHRHHATIGGTAVYCSDGEWHPDGTRFVALLRDPTQSSGVGPIVILTFDPPGSPAVAPLYLSAAGGPRLWPS